MFVYEKGLSMKFLQAIIMGLVQGITEFIPVSSSGHLAVIKALFGFETDTGVLFDVLLHVATIVAICVVYYKDIMRLVVEFVGIVRDVCVNASILAKAIAGNNTQEKYIRVISNAYRRFVLLLVVSTVPTGLIGVLINDVVDFATGNLLITGICFISTALIVMMSDYLPEGGKRLKEVNYADAFGVGIAQGIATLPGLSRSGVTITASLLCGFDRKFAAKYSFIMSIPAIMGALILELTEIGEETITAGDVGCYLMGMVIAAIVGVFILKFLLGLIHKKSLKYFSFYCLGMGFLSIIIYIIKLK